MDKYRRVISSITDLMADEDQYVTDYLRKRKIDYSAFRERMLKELEKKGNRRKETGGRSKK